MTSTTRPCQAPDCGNPNHSELEHWGGSGRRQYAFCAKCGRPKPPSAGYVCQDCVGTPGLYGYCAVAGDVIGEESRAYVCEAHLAR